MLLQTQVESFTVRMANSSLCKLTQVLTVTEKLGCAQMTESGRGCF